MAEQIQGIQRRIKSINSTNYQIGRASCRERV